MSRVKNDNADSRPKKSDQETELEEESDNYQIMNRAIAKSSNEGNDPPDYSDRDEKSGTASSEQENLGPGLPA